MPRRITIPVLPEELGILPPTPRMIRGSHQHECGTCGTIWEHGDDCSGSDKAHQCPNCGRMQWFIYHGEEQPTYLTGSCAKLMPNFRFEEVYE
jgi:hypothetical protein